MTDTEDDFADLNGTLKPRRPPGLGDHRAFQNVFFLPFQCAKKVINSNDRFSQNESLAAIAFYPLLNKIILPLATSPTRLGAALYSELAAYHVAR